MKKTLQITGILFAGILLICSCKKPIDLKNTPPPNIASLQHRWTLDSVVVYDNGGFNGLGVKWDGVTGTSDYRTDNMVYTQLNGLISVGNQNFNDTAKYIYQPDKNIIITNIIESGLASGLNDTTKVFLLNDSHLVTGDITESAFGYFRKVYCHR